jgi:hypothetical protein
MRTTAITHSVANRLIADCTPLSAAPPHSPRVGAAPKVTTATAAAAAAAGRAGAAVGAVAAPAGAEVLNRGAHTRRRGRSIGTGQQHA